ncbi:transcriptional regulatory protein DegU [Pedobacter glucosidilyticus]|nr:transcriptional regulatory protein DegU [Pedobacter glucosidilyticus]
MNFSMTKNISIGIIEDNEKLLNNYSEFFQLQDNYTLSFGFPSVDDFLRNFDKKEHIQPDIILLDINLPGTSGIDGIKILKEYFPKAIIVMLTAYSSNSHIITALENGASGYLVKGMSLHDIKSSLANYENDGSAISPNVAKKLIEHFNHTKKQEEIILKVLTGREKDITKCIVNGLSHKETAEQLNIKASTVNHHLKNIYIKLGVNTKTALIAKVMNNKTV